MCFKRQASFNEILTEDEIQSHGISCGPFQLNDWKNIFFQVLYWLEAEPKEKIYTAFKYSGNTKNGETGRMWVKRKC